MTAYDYGNARLRARKSRFLTSSDYRLLLDAADLDGVIGMLSGTRYAADVEAALPRYRSIQVLDGAVTRNLGRTLAEVAAFYEDDAARAVALLLERWDLRNVTSVLRGVAGRATPAEILATLVPAGTIAPTVLRSLASASDLRPLVDLLVALAVPSVREAASVVRAWPRYERTGDPAQLETAIRHVYALRWNATLADLGLPSLTRLVQREADRANVFATLRLSEREGEHAAEVMAGQQWLPGSTDSAILTAAAVASTREEAGALLSPGLPPEWGAALDRWVGRGDSAQTSIEIDAAITLEMAGLFSSGDPLGVDIPIAFTSTLEGEARNLRLVGRNVVAGRPPDAALEMMVIPW